MTTPIFKNAWPYQQDILNLPVGNLTEALPFYQKVMGFELLTHDFLPQPKALLKRDYVTIGLSQNGGDPTQDGCFFEVNDVEIVFEELKINGLAQAKPDFRIDQHGEKQWKVFFVIAPDGLCFCVGQVL